MLRRATKVRLDRLYATHIELMPEHADLSLVVLFHLQLVLLELVHLVANQFHLLDLLRNLAFDLFRRSTLVVEFGSKRVHDLIETMIRWT